MFPKIIHRCPYSEYISARSCHGLVFNNGTQVTDLCGHITPISEPVNSEASVLEALVTCSNIMCYRSNVHYLVYYIASDQKWHSANNIPNHYRQQPPAHADFHYHAGICVTDLEPLSGGQNPVVTYYELHAYQLTCKVRTMVSGRVFWDHMTYNPYCLPPIKALSIADMLGADEIYVFLGHQTVNPICGHFSFSFIATLLDGKFPSLSVANYKVSCTKPIRKITSNQ